MMMNVRVTADNPLVTFDVCSRIDSYFLVRQAGAELASAPLQPRRLPQPRHQFKLRRHLSPLQACKG